MVSESVIWNELGNIYLKIGSCAESIAAYRKAIELAPQFGMAYSNLASVYCFIGKFAEAIPLYKKSIHLLGTDEEKALTWNKLGDAYWRTQAFDSAIAAYSKSKEFAMVNTHGNGLALEKTVLPVEEDFEELSSFGDDDNGKVEMLYDVPECKEPLGSVDQVVEAELNIGEITIREFDKELNFAGVETDTSDSPQPVPAKDGVFGLSIGLQSPGCETGSVLPRKNITSWFFPTQDDPEYSGDPDAKDPSQQSSSKTGWVFGPHNATGKAKVLAATNCLPQDLTGAMAQPAGLQPTIQGAVEEVGQLLLEKDTPEVEGEATLLFALFGNRFAEPGIVQESLNSQAASPLISPDDPMKRNVDQEIKTNIEEIPQRKIDRQPSIESYKKIVGAVPSNDKAWFALGKLYKDNGQHEEATATFEQATLLCPNNRDYHYHLGLVYAARKQHQEAVNRFIKVIQLDPEFIVAHCALAGSYRRLGMDTEALKYLKIAAPGMQNESEYNRACFEAIYGNIEKAVELLKIALQSKQVSLEWLHSDPDLDYIRGDERFKSLLHSEF
jgi:tetratricopeptide (TPR) repeat protein